MNTGLALPANGACLSPTFSILLLILPFNPYCQYASLIPFYDKVRHLDDQEKPTEIIFLIFSNAFDSFSAIGKSQRPKQIKIQREILII